MERHKYALWARRIAWIGWAALAAFALLLPEQLSISPVSELLLILGLVLLAALLSIAMVLGYWQFFSHWYGFLTLITAMGLSRLWFTWSIAYGNLNLVVVLVSVGLIPAIGVALAIFMWCRDASVKLLGLVLPLFLWGVLIFSRPYGGPFMLLLDYLSDLEKNEGTIWWLETMTCLLFWSLPLAVTGFIVHTFRLLAREIWGE